ncbi:zinc-binding metallopeptidase family protein [Methylobrevis albus]|uniref:Zinc-binding peptidase n=1 Tax=Methylobrevis albus TaxID=2793297 RepID=A0A931I1L5_9HYPH|nr:putative zinc-binding peptidase [Methylobrevis albus]MBH0237268.1 putative zinc-binding peptidase [Methylobrevis albus]
MKLFECQACGQTLDFGNTFCNGCSRRLGFLPDRLELKALDADGEMFRPVDSPNERWFFCVNAESDACNWMLPEGSDDIACPCCRHNRTIPDLSDPANHALWRRLEGAKHHLFYSLLRLGLPHEDRMQNPTGGLAFDFLSDGIDADGNPKPVLTGHEDGLITLNVLEADDAEREKRRAQMGEPYRTLVGHFRHEIAHYYWDVLVRDGGRIDASREAFGDESDDYMAALQRHYQNGPVPGWPDSFISAYAASHPWEDFAETFAHYLHIVDTLDTAKAFGLNLRSPIGGDRVLRLGIGFDPYDADSAEMLVAAWVPLTFAINSINRSMGQPDLYPFVLSQPVVAKLQFVHDLIHGHEIAAAAVDASAAA